MCDLVNLAVNVVFDLLAHTVVQFAFMLTAMIFWDCCYDILRCFVAMSVSNCFTQNLNHLVEEEVLFALQVEVGEGEVGEGEEGGEEEVEGLVEVVGYLLVGCLLYVRLEEIHPVIQYLKAHHLHPQVSGGGVGGRGGSGKGYYDMFAYTQISSSPLEDPQPLLLPVSLNLQ